MLDSLIFHINTYKDLIGIVCIGIELCIHRGASWQTKEKANSKPILVGDEKEGRKSITQS